MTVSLIIPTHNRSASLRKMLLTLEQQSYPLDELEVIVVADGCNDDTIDMLKTYAPVFRLKFTELPGLGASSARNKGASLATGKYLVFVDDDMEVSKDFVKEHIDTHDDDNIVVIGYSPFKLESKASIQRMTLREWWEEKFQEMREKSHRFKYSDLTSGNFSLSSELFRKVGGFDTSLLCREDYELGFRLIEAGALFRFVYSAKALHNDAVTNLRRSLQRKKAEGMADIQIKNAHPEFVNWEAIYYLSQRPRVKSVLLKAMEHFPRLSDMIAGKGASFMDYCQGFNLPIPWLKMNKRLHQYWYLRGLMQGAGSVRELNRIIAVTPVSFPPEKKISIDLAKGVESEAEKIDEQKPLSIDVYYGENFIGTIDHEAGSEPIKGYHLRKLLKRKFYNRIADALYPHYIFEKKK